jgi:hypothetical protein
LGTTMPVTRDSPSIQGDVPGPDPARAPPSKAIARAGLACRGQPAGVYLACARSANAGRRCPRERGVPGPRLVHTPSEPSGLQRSVVRPGRRCDPGEWTRVQNPDKDEVPSWGDRAPSPDYWGLCVGCRDPSTAEVAARRAGGLGPELSLKLRQTPAPSRWGEVVAGGERPHQGRGTDALQGGYRAGRPVAQVPPARRREALGGTRHRAVSPSSLVSGQVAGCSGRSGPG